MLPAARITSFVDNFLQFFDPDIKLQTRTITYLEDSAFHAGSGPPTPATIEINLSPTESEKMAPAQALANTTKKRKITATVSRKYHPSYPAADFLS